MDEAAAKLRVALYSLPDNLKEQKREINAWQQKKNKLFHNVTMNVL